MNLRSAFRIGLVAALPAAIAISTTASSAVPITVLSKQHDTWVMRGRLQDPDPTREERSMSSTFPTSDSFVYGEKVEARAEASLFEIYTLAQATRRENEDPDPRFRAGASASTEFVFSSQQYALAEIHLEFQAWGNWLWGGGSANLLDLTTGLELGAFSYDGAATLGWADGPELGTKINSLTWDSIPLIPGHEYKFKMSSWSDSNVPDADSRLTRLYGLEVPEPSTLAFMFLGGTVLLAARHRRQ